MKIKHLINPWNIFGEIPFSKRMKFTTLLTIFILFSISFYFTGRKVFLQNSYAGIILFLQIFIFGFLLKNFSGKLFSKIWIFKNKYVKNKWEALNIWSLRITHFLLYIGIFSLIFLHLGQAILLHNSNSLLAYQQGAIGLVFLGLFIWFLFGKDENSLAHKVALTYFFFMIFIIVYDFLLFGVIQITGGSAWTGRLEVPIKLSFMGILTMTFPEFFVVFFLNLKQIAKTLGFKN